MKDYLDGIKKFIREHPWLTLSAFLVIVFVCALYLRSSRWQLPENLPTGNNLPSIPRNSQVVSEERTLSASSEVLAATCFRTRTCTILHYYFYESQDGIGFLATRKDVTNKGTDDEYILQQGTLKSLSDIDQIIDILTTFRDSGYMGQTMQFFLDHRSVTEAEFRREILGQ